MIIYAIGLTLTTDTADATEDLIIILVSRSSNE
jgi:hypothetical protein